MLQLCLAYLKVSYSSFCLIRPLFYIINCSGLAVVQCVAMQFLPRTPHFLVLQQKEQEAAEVLRRIHSTGSVRQELANIRHSCQQSTKVTCTQLFSNEVSFRIKLFFSSFKAAIYYTTGL